MNSFSPGHQPVRKADAVIASINWYALARVMAIVTGKGGVGKTTVACHIAGILAAAGKRVLLIDMDPQGTTAIDLGYDNTDQGAGLVAAVIAGSPVLILHDVRPGLDVVPGGADLVKLADHLTGERSRQDGNGPDPSPLLLAKVIQHITAGYDLVVVDCPPTNNQVITDAVLALVRYVLVPTHSDKASREGVLKLGNDFARAHMLNAHLRLLGVVLYGSSSRANEIRRVARLWLEKALAGAAPVFDTMVRSTGGAAFDVREQGKLATELSGHEEIAAEFQGLAVEAMRRLVELETAGAGQ